MKTNILLTMVLGLLLAVNISTFATKHLISVADYQYTPKDIPNVHLGDTIHWYWVNDFHTTTSDTIPTGAASWDHLIDSLHLVFEYVPTKLGTYKYHCSNHLIPNDMVGSFTVLAPQGISHSKVEPVITIYPNPVLSNLFIHIESTNSYIKDVKIYTLAGKLIRELTFTTSPGSEDKTVNISDLGPGIFMIEFIDNNNYTYSRKFTKL